MPTYSVTSRIKHAAETAEIEAETREHAIQAAIDAADEGDEVEVHTVVELPGPVGGDGGEGGEGATGTTGGAFARAAPAGPTKAELNDMTKDELMAVASNEGVEVNHSHTKADIVDAIVAKRKRS